MNEKRTTDFGRPRRPDLLLLSLAGLFAFNDEPRDIIVCFCGFLVQGNQSSDIFKGYFYSDPKYGRHVHSMGSFRPERTLASVLVSSIDCYGSLSKTILI